ncbi:MAG TPA: hypothetical protein VMK65_04110 [Longimicrobiales bacterium]|nr:hypothetical protein [Longimicrobiales bacterium]
MDDETRAAFGRMDRYFELAQVQHAELRADVRSLDKRLGGVEDRLGGVEDRLGALEASLRSFRDWVAEQFAQVRAALQQLTARVEVLERHQRHPLR